MIALSNHMHRFFALLLLFLGVCGHAQAQTLKVCATVPELGGLVQAVGGDQVSVTVFAKGSEDPHYLDARPSFIKALSDADLFVQIGLDLEAGWAPLLLRSSRNSRIQTGAPGFVDASTAITPLDIPTGEVDRSMGDIHPQGNPHYLADPLNGLKVAALLRDRLTALQPGGGPVFARNYELFRKRLGEALVGKELAGKYDVEKLALLHQHGRLVGFLAQQGDRNLLGGWIGKVLPGYGAKILTYHKSWPYFASRFGMIVVGHLEPKPGIPPGPGHLLNIINVAREERVKILLAEPWINPQVTKVVADKAGLTVVRAAPSQMPDNQPYDYILAMDGLIAKVAACYA